jgi:hypothetical protein
VTESKQHPIVAGLLALAGVGTVLGVVLGLAVWVGAGALGLRAGDPSVETGGGGATLVVPKPVKTTAASDPLVTLKPGEETSSAAEASPSKSKKSKKSKPAKKQRDIKVSSGQTSVGPMQRIDLTGSYSSGDGAVLQVQRFSRGQWLDFPVTASVSGGTFSTYVQTSQAGPNKFRMFDSSTGKASNAVTVTVG